MNESLAVELVTEEGNEMKVEMTLASDQVGPGGHVSDLCVMAFGHDAIRRAAIRNGVLPDALRVLGSNTAFVGSGTGDRLSAETTLVGAAGPMATWRATLYQGSATQPRAQWKRVAEVTQTQWDSQDAPPVAARSPDPDAMAGARAAGNELPTDDAGSISVQRRKQIFRGALQVIGKKGYGAATIREIAAAAKLPIPTMYQYIKSKEDILYMITSGCMEDLIKSFQEDLSTKKASKERLTRAISAYVDYIEINRRYINLVYRETRSLSKENREKIFDIERVFTGFWRKILEDGQASGELKLNDANLTANFIYFLCTVWAIRYWSIDQYSPDVVKHELTEFILRGLGLRAA